MTINSVKSSMAQRRLGRRFAVPRLGSLSSEAPTATVLTYWMVVVLFAAMPIGCGGEPSTSPSKPAADKPDSSAPKRPEEKQADPPAETNSSSLVRVDEDGRRWIDDIPYDVFFDDPLAVAANEHPVENAGSSPGSSDTRKPSSPPNTNDRPVPPKTDSDTGWKSLISMETLITEIKRIRIVLNESTKSIGNYNRRYEEIQIQGALLVAIAGIVGEHPDSVIWKPHALQVRSLGANISEAAQSRGREAYKQTRDAVDQCVSVLSGELPPDLKDTPADAELADLADRGQLMKRMEQSLQQLKGNASDVDSLKDNADDVLHEISLLAALAKTITSPSYDSAEDQDYIKYSTEIIQASIDSTKAIRDDEFDRLSDARQRIQTKCDACHKAYR